MEDTLIHKNMLRALRERVPHKATLTRRLVEKLAIEREAVYRRLRGEVPFSLQEAAILSREFGLSVDNIINGDPLDSFSFKLYIDDHDKPLETDIAKLGIVIDLMKHVKSEAHSELYSTANSLPQGIFLKYDHISRFFMFKWMYQYENSENVRPYEAITIAPEILDLHRKYYKDAMHVKNTSYIWDNLIFQYLVNDLKYFESIKLISSQSIQAIKEELFTLVEDVESFAARGEFETGNKVYFYISNINFDSSYSYLETSKLQVSSIKAFTLNRVTTADKDTYMRLKKWIQSMKRFSTLISESGEIQRVQFFEKQRRIIETL